MFRYAEGSGSAALFEGILDLDIFSATEVICSDYSNHCLRLVSFTQSSAATSTFAGKCGQGGTADGDRLNTARFTLPLYTQMNNNRTALFVQEHSLNLRIIDKKTNNVATIFAFGGTRWGMNLVGDLMYLLSRHKVTAFNLDTKEENLVAGGDGAGNAVGSFQQTKFHTPSRLLEWRDGQQVLLLVADRDNNRFVEF